MGENVPTVYARTLRRAADIVGGEDRLALKLRVTPSHLALWLSGAASPPGDVFLRAVDIVLDHEIERIHKKEEPQRSGA